MITYHVEHSNFKLTQKRKLSKWIKSVINNSSFEVGDLNFIYCDDPYILDLNRKYLNHNYYTDVITFDNTEDFSEENNIISGDIFISIDTVKANAEEYGSTFEEEFLRVTIHGVLHLLGYDDKTEEEVSVMRQTENYCIEKYRILDQEK